MDKTGIKNFAIGARNILRESAIKKAGLYGITIDKINDPIQKTSDSQVFRTIARNEIRLYKSDLKKRANLVLAIKSMGFEQVIEETAYTWFNRLIAIRFMEVNDYLPSRVRVLSSEAGGSTPDIMTNAMEAELNLTLEELDSIQKAKDENRYDDAFQMLFIKQCNELNIILPGLFEKTDDYMELLLDISYTGDGVVRMLNSMIPEGDFNVEKQGQVEIIGWMYQYYNTELKDDTFAKLKKNIKITKERIPAATQLFTPDWIVRYMVENSLGRVWIDHLRAVDETIDEKAKAEEFGWKYYLPEAEQEEKVAAELVKVRAEYKDLTPQDILCIDPCSGSGHILVYMFDVLLAIYESEGISERDAAFDILEKNIFGLDIDKRAYQLSYFALMMKGRGVVGRRFFRGVEDENGECRPIELNVYAIDESNGVNKAVLEAYGVSMDADERQKARTQVETLLDEMYDAKEYGSIINVTDFDMELVKRFLADREENGQLNIGHMSAEREAGKIWKLAKIGKVLAQKYDVVVTNPPYMGVGGMGAKILGYIKKNYTESKADLFAVFIEKCEALSKVDSCFSMITQNAWMFLSSFEKLRVSLKSITTINMLHLGSHAFNEIGGEVVQTVAFLNRKREMNEYQGVYVRLINFVGETEKANKALEAYANHTKGIHYIAKKSDFAKIPGMPYVYWGGKQIYYVFDRCDFLKSFGRVTLGMRTGDNNRFLRLWFEISIKKLKVDALSAEDAQKSRKKWFPYNKGGEFRKWYGNLDYVVNWENNGEEIKENTRRVYPELGDDLGWKITSEDRYFYRGLAWSRISSFNFGVRVVDTNLIFDTAAPMFFPEASYIDYFAGLMCSKVASYILNMLNPTLTFQVGDVSKLPIIIDEDKKRQVDEISKKCEKIEKEDWDSFETSWDFKRHPLLPPILEEKIQEQKNDLVKKDNKTKADVLGNVKESDEYTQEKLEFVTFCIENMAEKLSKDSVDIYDVWTKKSNLLYDYIIPCYDILHTQGKDYILDNILETMEERGIKV